MSIAPITPSFGFGVTPGFGLNPAHGVSATPPRTDVGIDTAQQGVSSFGQVLADRIAAFGPATSATAVGPAAAPLSATGAAAPATFASPEVTAANMTTGAVETTRAGQGASGGYFGEKLGELSALHARSDKLAVAAATGDLKDIHEYTIAANEAGIATQLAVTVRDKALQAFNDIIRMQL
ncbi:flagellar hook-basal body complex protein FliE [Mobilicoccus massiliensis]|uniref:flagellar hook-basal body complex protein FliE n=1 Tax=Mobilicoccus massiliensis TaxID=1522310 RepID=UPI00069389B4|nr:flagellar hook-basal body complex protein FliE [Mobilicoccus massiliensis]